MPNTRTTRRRGWPRAAAVALALALLAGSGPAATQPAPQIPAAAHAGRVRVSLDSGWRFTTGDPPGNAVDLRYDVRPEVRDARDDQPADAQPRSAGAPRASGTGASTQTVLKPWILPTGNAFVADPARRAPRPATEWRGDVAYLRPDFDDRAWRRVDLPHDWAIAGPFDTTGPTGGMGRLPSWGIGWYRRRLTIPAGDAGRSVFLDVDGAMSYATVWLNGHLVGGWPYGYSSWRLDLTPYVVPGGTNQLAIRLDNPPSSSRWYPGGGLYRHVWLTTTAPVHVAQWGTVVRTRRVSPASATLDVDVTVDNAARGDAALQLTTRVYALDARGRPAGAPAATVAAAPLAVPAGGQATAHGSATLARPRLWGPPPTQRPNRYVAVTEVARQGSVVDRYETPFGVRDLRFSPDSGLFVNGEPVPIRGVNNHHDLGALGAAFNARAAERQLELLRAMGANAVRMSHNPPAPELLALADSMGFLVLDEAFDSWVRQKTPLDYHLLFPDWSEQDLRAMVRRDRNHPSVILWSVGNEVGEQYTDTAGAAIARRLVEVVRAEDPTRPSTSAMNYAKPDMPLPATLGVIGLNYQGEGIRQDPEFAGTDRIRTPPQYDAFHARFPDRVVLSTETASAFSSRGVYLFPVTPATSAPTRDGRGGDSRTHQVSAYELHAVDFGASADKVFDALDHHPFVAGEFVWTGFDYLGEPTPYYTSRSSYSGIFDLAGFKKDRFWLYQAHWRPDLPMAHLLPHWTWPERVGQVTPVHVFTSGDEAELFLNGRSLGRRKKGPHDYRLRWDSVTYAPGTLEVVAYRNGRRWATDRVRTAGAAARLTATPDRATIRADGRDLAFVTVRVTDAAGVTAPRAADALRFTIDGPGEIVGTDNGDATSFEPFTAPARRAFNGLALVIVRAKPGGGGRITLTAVGEGLRAGTAVIAAVGRD